MKVCIKKMEMLNYLIKERNINFFRAVLLIFKFSKIIKNETESEDNDIQVDRRR